MVFHTYLKDVILLLDALLFILSDLPVSLISLISFHSNQLFFLFYHFLFPVFSNLTCFSSFYVRDNESMHFFLHFAHHLLE